MSVIQCRQQLHLAQKVLLCFAPFRIPEVFHSHEPLCSLSIAMCTSKESSSYNLRIVVYLCVSVLESAFSTLASCWRAALQNYGWIVDRRPTSTPSNAILQLSGCFLTTCAMGTKLERVAQVDEHKIPRGMSRSRVGVTELRHPER